MPNLKLDLFKNQYALWEQKISELIVNKKKIPQAFNESSEKAKNLIEDIYGKWMDEITQESDDLEDRSQKADEMRIPLLYKNQIENLLTVKQACIQERDIVIKEIDKNIENAKALIISRIDQKLENFQDGQKHLQELIIKEIEEEKSVKSSFWGKLRGHKGK